MFWLWLILLAFFVWLLPSIIAWHLVTNARQAQRQLQHRVHQLELRVQQLDSEQSIPSPASPQPEGSTNQPPRALTPPLPTIVTPIPITTIATETTVYPTPPERHKTPAPLEPDEQSTPIVTSILASLKNWFTGGNAIVRIGVLILLTGVVSLLRLVNEYVSIPITAWLSLIALLGTGLAGLGLTLSQKRRGYGLSLQGAGLAILYLTLFSAYRIYDVLPSGVTFGLLAGLAIITAVFSVRQNALPLAVLAFGGAFLAPILTSTSQGQVVMLFSYYLLLNMAVAWIAHQRTWKILNLLSASVTFGVATLWGWQSFDPDLRWPMEGLLIAHLALYVFIGLRYSQQLTHLPPTDTTAIISIDTALLFGVPLVAFGLQAGLMQDIPYALAISSAVLAAGYLSLATYLAHQSSPTHRLTEAVLALGLGFLTLVIPLAFDAQWTSSGWVIQGLALVWVGTRHQRIWQVIFGLGLQALSLLILIWLWLVDTAALSLELSMTAASIFVAALLLRTQTVATSTEQPMTVPFAAQYQPLGLVVLWTAGLTALWALQEWWELLWAAERLSLSLQTHGLQFGLNLIILHLIGLLFSTRLLWAELQFSLRVLGAAIGFWISLLLLSDPSTGFDLSFLGIATLAWLILQLVTLWHIQAQPAYRFKHPIRFDQALALLNVLLISSLWSIQVWSSIASLAPVLLPLCLLWLIWLAPTTTWPIWFSPRQAQQDIQPLVLLGFGSWIFWVNATANGQYWGIPYLPIFSLLDLCLILLMLWLWLYLSHRQRTEHPPTPPQHDIPQSSDTWTLPFYAGLGLAAFWTLSSLVVRTTHQWSDTPLWPAAWVNDTVQTSLTIVWSSVALVMTVLASRFGWRPLWLVGIGLLGVVVGKLLLVDLSNIQATARVISFIGAGLLMLLIGYIAPLPPEQTTAKTDLDLPKPPTDSSDTNADSRNKPSAS